MPHPSYDPAAGWPRLMPFLTYRDVAAALDFLSKAFGFTEELRWTDEEGIVRVAEMRVADNFYIGLTAGGEGYVSPRDRGAPVGSTLVFVDAVDEHRELVRAADVDVVSEPADRPWGLRQYVVEDIDGHRWEFTQFLTDVPPASWGAVTPGDG
jgi:uncharacterized glyoxalase superfamily protein PhnB